MLLLVGSLSWCLNIASFILLTSNTQMALIDPAFFRCINIVDNGGVGAGGSDGSHQLGHCLHKHF
jgi:hypothetical protein